MTKKKRNKKKSSKTDVKLQKRKNEKEKEWRKFRAIIHAQLDNAFVELLYVFDEAQKVITDEAEDYFLGLLFDPKTVRVIEEKIKDVTKNEVMLSHQMIFQCPTRLR